MSNANETDWGWFARLKAAFGDLSNDATKQAAGFKKSVDIASAKAAKAAGEAVADAQLQTLKIELKAKRKLFRLIGADEDVQDDNQMLVETAIVEIESHVRKLNAAGHKVKARELDLKRREIDRRLQEYMETSDFGLDDGNERGDHDDDDGFVVVEPDELADFPHMRRDKHDEAADAEWNIVADDFAHLSKDEAKQFEAARRTAAKQILQEYADECEVVAAEAEAYADMMTGVPLGKPAAAPPQVKCDAEKAIAGTPVLELPRLELPDELLDYLDAEGVAELLVQKMYDRNNSAKDRAEVQIREIASRFRNACARIDGDRGIDNKAKSKEAKKTEAAREIDAVVAGLRSTLEATAEAIVHEWKTSEKRAKDGEFAKNVEIVSSSAMAGVAAVTAGAAVVTVGHGGAVGTAVLACMAAVQKLGKVVILAWNACKEVETVQVAVLEQINTLQDKLKTLNDQDAGRLGKARISAQDVGASAANAALGGDYMNTVTNLESNCRLWGDKLAELYFGHTVACKQLHVVQTKLATLKGQAEEYDNQIEGLEAVLNQLLDKAYALGKHWDESHGTWQEAEAMAADLKKPGWLVAADRIVAAGTSLATSLAGAIGSFNSAKDTMDALKAVAGGLGDVAGFGAEAKDAAGQIGKEKEGEDAAQDRRTALLGADTAELVRRLIDHCGERGQKYRLLAVQCDQLALPAGAKLGGAVDEKLRKALEAFIDKGDAHLDAIIGYVKANHEEYARVTLGARQEESLRREYPELDQVMGAFGAIADRMKSAMFALEERLKAARGLLGQKVEDQELIAV
jgi:hypothetical protein